MENTKGKLILAVLQGDDYEATVKALNKEGFMATLLSSTGGFMKKRSTTVMIGVEEEKLQQVLDILRSCTKKRTETVYQNLSMSPAGMPPVPMMKTVGGAAVFVMNLEQIEKF